ncbi:MAG: hypothetical protein KAJ93_01115 [Methanosarcinales archaeon]|nr:hypothetical protein [Methanosarcinales archaeon]
MAAPTVRFRTFPITVSVGELDTAGERLAAIAGQSVISTGAGNELDFGTVDISGGAANSLVKMLVWDITADGGNTLVEDFLFWLSSNGFDQAGTVVKYQPISGDDQGTPSLTENYIVNAVVGSYTWGTLDESEPGAQNVYPTDEGSSMVLSTTADDVIMVALYVVVADNETTGTFKGTDAGNEFQYSFKYSYS